MICLNCSQETSNPKFCSRSCAAKYNNRAFPKRALESICADCKRPCSKSRSYCRSCWKQRQENQFLNRLDTIKLSKLQDKRAYQVNSQIRTWARQIYQKSEKPKQCAVCGYDRHYEVCHIKPISDFSPDSLLSDINSLNNLIALCPNHHWELDNGIISPVSFHRI